MKHFKTLSTLFFASLVFSGCGGNSTTLPGATANAKPL